jgi:microcystin degradation protein MlrC
MRVAIAQVVQETCTFTPVRTTLAAFEGSGLMAGERGLRALQGVGAVGGFLAGMRSDAPGRTMVLPISMTAVAGGPLAGATLRAIERRFLRTLREAEPVEALYLSLHGACVAETEPDVDGRLLELARDAVGPGVPIVASLDHHANVTRRMIEHLDSVVAHRTQPHDTFATGRLAAAQVAAILRGDLRPTVAWRKIPMVSHQERFATTAGPMRDWFDQARAWEARPGVAAVSPFPMQPWLDVPEAGWATVVVTNGDATLADRIAATHALAAWDARADFQPITAIPVEAALDQARAMPPGLVVVSDTGDSVLGGAPGDSPHILAAILGRGTTGRTLVPLVDPAAVRRARDAGVGAEVTMPIGGAISSGFHAPLPVTGVVRAIRRGPIEVEVVGMASFDMGWTARLDVGDVRVVLSERPGVGGVHPAVFRSVGLEPADARLVVVKTAANFQYYADLAAGVVRVDSPGPTMSRLGLLPWRRIPRPMYPLDRDAVFAA